MVFWLALAAGIAVIASGFLLLFPFYVTNIFGMQIAQGIHAIIALLFIALILAHIYIGTVGMEGAFEAMGQGTVDLNWAKEHHSLWLEQTGARRTRAARPPVRDAGGVNPSSIAWPGQRGRSRGPCPLPQEGDLRAASRRPGFDRSRHLADL